MVGKQVTTSVEERVWINWKPHRLRFGFQGLPSLHLYLYYIFFHLGCLSLHLPAWHLCKMQEWVAGAFQEFGHHVAFSEPGLERRLQPVQSGTSLTSSGWSNYSVITSRPIYRGSQTKAFHCSPIFLVWRLGFFIPCSAGCILCLPKTQLYNSNLRTLQEGEIPRCCFSISSFSDRDRLIPHCCCQRGSDPTEGRKKMSCSGPSTPPPGFSPDIWERRFWLSRSLCNQLSGTCSRSSQRTGTILQPAPGTGCSEHQVPGGEHLPGHSTAAFPLLAGPRWLAENGPNAGKQSESASALHKCSMEDRCRNTSQEPVAAQNPMHGI